MDRLIIQLKKACIVMILLFASSACQTGKNSASIRQDTITQTSINHKKKHDSLEYYQKQSLKSTADEKLLPQYKPKSDTLKKNN